MEIKKGVNYPKKGMQRDKHPGEIGKDEYTFAMNANTHGYNGDGYVILQNEDSNIKCSTFKAGYKVIGHRFDINEDRTYFFLTNPTTGCSEIGYIDSLHTPDANQAIENNCSCNVSVVLEDGLENTEQQGYCTYNTLMSDCCEDPLQSSFCLGFDVDYPIHPTNVEIKDERTGKRMYFTDFKNPQRYIQLDNIDHYYLDTEGCEEPTDTCLQCDKMRIFPLFDKPCIQPRAIQAGGNLRAGLYEATLAYCDSTGNEVSNYYATTNPIPIFDESQVYLTDNNLDYRTNFSIGLDIGDIDNSYDYFKVVVIYRSGLDQSVTYKELGVFPTSTGRVTISSLENKADSNPQVIKHRKPFYKKAKGLAAGNGYLFQFGLETQREINLQPVVNLMGGFVKWNTVMATEDVYKDGVNSSKYAQFMRDEVYPFSIKFFMDGGKETANFTFIARPPSTNEVEEFINSEGTVLVDDVNVDSISEFYPDCAESNRRFRWQFENTATIDEELCPSDVGTIETTVTKYSSCQVRDGAGELLAVDTIAGPEVLQIDTELSLVDYISQNLSLILNSTDTQWSSIKTILGSEYPESFCEPSFEDTCGAPVIESYQIFPLSVDSEVQLEVDKNFADYNRVERPASCSGVSNVEDTAFMSSYMDTGEVVYERSAVPNSTCSTSSVLPITAVPPQGVYLLNKGEVGGNTSLLTAKDSNASGTAFNAKLHSNAVWFELEFGARSSVIVELSSRLCVNPDDNTGTQIRVTFYNDCTTTTNVAGYTTFITDMTDSNDANKFITLDASDFPSGKAYVAIDSEMTESTIGTDTVYRLAPPCGCFSIYQRDVETINEITFSGLSFGKSMVYKAECTAFLPDYTKVNSCDPVPYQTGKFSYWESELKYPCNPELWDSSSLTIDTSDIPVTIQSDFEGYYVDSVTGTTYNLNSGTDFQDKPIRHYKFPCTTKVPHMSDTTQEPAPFSKSVVYPIGVTIDNQVISAFLDIAVKNGLITTQERFSINKYEIYRGDRRYQKSVVSKGILFDTYKYKERDVLNDLSSQDVLYSNYPLNTLGKDTLNDVDHPFDSKENKSFTFHSPDTHFYKPTIPQEMKIDGYLFGSSQINFDIVNNHPRYSVLGDKAYAIATTLAIAEVGFDIFLQVSDWSIEQFTGDATTTAGAVAAFVAASVGMATQAFFKVGSLRHQWIETFRNIGQLEQFAYYSATLGHYNSFLGNTVTNSMYRAVPVSSYLRDGRWNITNVPGQPDIPINNLDRESSVFLDVGNTTYNVNYPSAYINHDNQNYIPSLASRRGTAAVGKSSYVGQTSVPYVSLKDYLPGQYGSINSIEWLSTNYCGDLSQDNTCDPIFGGDTYISRFAVKRKFPFFTTTAFGLADRLPFKYSNYFNIKPVTQTSELSSSRFYLDYMINDEYNNPLAATVFPSNRSDYNFDNDDGSNVFYEGPPKKFYLYSYGFPYFLVESIYNCNYRYAKEQPAEDFYPNMSDLIDMTQESNVSIREPERFFFNTVYLGQGERNVWWTLPDTYSRDLYDKINDLRNSVIYSRIDSSETDIVDPWLIYRPLDFYNFPTNYGELIDMSAIESEQILARFENGFSIFNSVDNIADRLTPENFKLGQGGIFTGRNVNFNKTDLGYAGTKNVAMVSCNFGHFWADAKRGQVFQLMSNGEGLSDITKGLEKWFKDQLPFKILKTFPDYDTDNNYKGIGISMGWDERLKRVFITKKDYVPNSDNLVYENGTFYLSEDLVITLTEVATQETVDITTAVGTFNGREYYFVNTGFSQNIQTVYFIWSGARWEMWQDFDPDTGGFNSTFCAPNTPVYYKESYLLEDDTVTWLSGCEVQIRLDISTQGGKTEAVLDSKHFTDCSWTVAYSPILEGWVSYYSFLPNYYVTYHDYFQTGINLNGSPELWSHLPHLSSHQVFYGNLYPFTVEYVQGTQGMNSVLQSLDYYMETKKFYERFNQADVFGYGFNKAVVYNNSQNSGLIELKHQDNNDLSQSLNYPKHKANSVEALQSEINGKWSFNHLYNIVRNEKSGLPLWLSDCANIEKTLNNRLLDYRSMYKDRLRGDYFLTRLTQDADSRFKMLFRFAIDERGYYEQ